MLWLGAASFKPEEITDASWSGNYQSEPGSVGRGAKADDGMVAAGHISLFSGRHIKRTEIRLTFFGIHRDDAKTISGPHGRKAASTTWRDVVAADPGADIIIEIAREIPWLCIGCNVHHP